MITVSLPWHLIKRYNWVERQCYLRDDILQWFLDRKLNHKVFNGNTPLIEFANIEDYVLFKLTWL